MNKKRSSSLLQSSPSISEHGDSEIEISRKKTLYSFLSSDQEKNGDQLESASRKKLYNSSVWIKMKVFDFLEYQRGT